MDKFIFSTTPQAIKLENQLKDLTWDERFY